MPLEVLHGALPHQHSRLLLPVWWGHAHLSMGKQLEESLLLVAKGPSMTKALANSQVSVLGKRQAHTTSAPTHETPQTPLTQQ